MSNHVRLSITLSIILFITQQSWWKPSSSSSPPLPPPSCLPSQALQTKFTPAQLRARSYRFAGVIEVGGSFTMRRGSGCSGCIFQRANRYQLLFSPSKLFIHTDKQGEKGDVRRRGRWRGVSDVRELFFFSLSSFPRLSLLSSPDYLASGSDSGEMGREVERRKSRDGSRTMKDKKSHMERKK